MLPCMQQSSLLVTRQCYAGTDLITFVDMRARNQTGEVCLSGGLERHHKKGDVLGWDLAPTTPKLRPYVDFQALRRRLEKN
jgi:hypothetical protein